MQCTRSAAVAAALLTLAVPAAQAVIILDSTWAEEGGSRADPSDGFDAAKALADRPQFAATIGFADNDGEEAWGSCSGTWIGNDPEQQQAYVLTAAHCFPQGTAADAYVYRSDSGEVHEGVDVVVHRQFVDESTTTGYDLAIVTLATPVTDAGRPPVLYAGDDEQDQLLTFVGYGSRGIGSTGQQDRFYDGAGDMAAAQGVVDVVQDGPKSDSDSGDYLGTFLPREDGSITNPHGGSELPATRLAGLLGSGDSGGPAFLKMGGRWMLAGVNSNGNSKAQYGDSSWFVRISARQRWILRHAPVARFAQ